VVQEAAGVQKTGRAIGEKGGKYMKTKIKYTEEPVGELKVIKDFLPPTGSTGFERRKR